MKCDYCGEESQYTIIIPKPFYFVSNESMYQLPQVYKRQDFTCLPCLEFETNELKECY